MSLIKKTCKYYLKLHDTDVDDDSWRGGGYDGNFGDELVCFEEVWDDSDYCILHMNFPEDEKSADFQVLLEEKNKKIEENIKNYKGNFKGAILSEINFKNRNIDGIDLSYSTIKGDVVFTGATINADFSDSTINGDVFFNEAIINAGFNGSVITGNVFFNDATIESFVTFGGATIKGNVDLTNLTIEGELDFDFYGSAIIEGDVLFNGSKAEKYALLKGAIINGKKIGD